MRNSAAATSTMHLPYCKGNSLTLYIRLMVLSIGCRLNPMGTGDFTNVERRREVRYCGFHPVLWMFDENFSQVRYAYSRKEPYIVEEATYTDSETNNRQKTLHGTTDWLKLLMACSVTACRYSLLESMIIRPSTYLEI